MEMAISGGYGMETTLWEGMVRLRGVTEVTFRGRRSTLCALDMWMEKDSWQAQGIVRS